MEHEKSIALMKFLSGVSQAQGVGGHVYVVGGAVRNHLLGHPVKDLDLVVDSIALGADRDSVWFAKRVCEAIPTYTNLAFNQYGVAIITVHHDWSLDDRFEMKGLTIEIANARKESYTGGGGKGKGYKPTDVQAATIEEDLYRREFTFNTLLWRLGDLAQGPQGVEVLDLTGLGLSDLRDEVIRTPLDPDRTFSDDPTRMLRALKFHLKYGMKISQPVFDSIRRNASSLTQMPWEASGTILVRDVFADPRRIADACAILESLGLLSVLQGMVRDLPPFAAYLNGQFPARSTDAKALLYLTEIGLISRPLSFLSEEQREVVRQFAENSLPDDANLFLLRLLEPPVENVPLIQEFGLQGRDCKKILIFAREEILKDPSLGENASRLREVVRTRLSRS